MRAGIAAFTRKQKLSVEIRELLLGGSINEYPILTGKNSLDTRKPWSLL